MANTLEQRFRITGMDCAACARNIESGVRKLAGVDASTINFTTEILRVRGDVSPDVVAARVRELGYDVREPDLTDDEVSGRSPGFVSFMWKRGNTRLTLLGMLLILPGLLFNELLPMLGLESPLLDVTSVAAMAVAGYPIAQSAWRSLRINREINMNVLMSVAAIGAVIIGAYSEAGLVMVLFALGEALEGYTAERARDSIRGLMRVAPNTATVFRPCIDCTSHLGHDGYESGPCPVCGIEEHQVPVEELKLGETIVVRPGERIPMDGVVTSGASAVNQAPITGESRLIPKEMGDEVFASSVNGEGSLEIEVTRLATDNTISRLIKMVEEAQEKRAPVQRYVDRFARVYTPVVVVVAALVAVLPPLLAGEPFWNPDASTQGWLYRALALLVVACPCALVISTPVSIVSAIANGARNGILFKGGAHLETLSRVRAIAFDKTGTLTKGEPAVIGVRSVDCTAGGIETCEHCDDLVALAGAVEKRSEHPLALAVLAESRQREVHDRYPAADGVRALAGQGVLGEVNGRQVVLGNHAYFDANIPHPDHCELVGEADSHGYTTVMVSDQGDYSGFITVADDIRESGRIALNELRQNGIDNLVMITGDNEATALKVARQLDITDIVANCMPAQKVTAVEQLKRQYGHVAMVGDGINDTPALATASIGIAIGNTAQAMETADVTLMSDDLRRLPFALKLSRATMRTIRINVGLSLGIKLVFLALVLLGFGSMWMAVLADMGTSLLVTLNGTRLVRRPYFPLAEGVEAP